MQPKISVIVPIYNPGEKKLKYCIKSILNQSFKEFELLLINDGSTDNSLGICKKFAKEDERIRVINKKNEGSIKARNRGIEEAIGNYITFIDSDDYINKDYLLKLYSGILENQDIVVCNIRKVFGNFKILGKKNKSWFFSKEKTYSEYEIRNQLVTAYFHGHPFPSSLCAKLYKRELLLDKGKYLKNIKFLGDDLFLNMEIFLKAKRVRLLPEELYYYRIGGGTSKWIPSHFNDIIEGYKIQKKVLDNFKFEKDHSNGIKIMLLNSFNIYIQSLIYSKKSEKEIEEIIKENLENFEIQEVIKSKKVENYFGKEYSQNLKEKNTNYFIKIIYKDRVKKQGRKFFLKIVNKLL